MIRGHEGEPDILLEPRRIRERGEVADSLSVRGDGPVFRNPRADHRSVDLHADELARYALGLRPLDRLLPDVVWVLVEVHGPTEAHLERVVVEDDVRGVVQDARLNPADLGRRDGADVVWLARLHDPIPELLRERAVPEVQLVADLRAPARPRDHERDPVVLRLHEMVVLEIENLVAHQVLHQVLRLLPLDLYPR